MWKIIRRISEMRLIDADKVYSYIKVKMIRL